MNAYIEMKNRHQREVDGFPLAFAFNKEQFAEGMKKLGLSPNDTKKIYRLGNTGGYYRREDAESLNEMFFRHAEELQGAIDGDATARVSSSRCLTKSLQTMSTLFQEILQTRYRPWG